jgi:uncharacterized protein
MTPEERKLVVELFDRLGTLEDEQRDPEAERLIRDGLGQAPNAPYALVQTVLVQDEALKRANARIRELEQGREAPARDTSFLGSMRDSLFGARESRGSVPSVRPDAPSQAPAAGMSPAWRSVPQPPQPPMSPGLAPGAAPMGMAPPMGMGAPMGMGGSFLGTAASTAAGVIGGALLLDGIRSMMGHHGAAQAAFDPGAHAALDPAASTASPWSGGGGELSREAGLDDIGRTSAVSDTQDRAQESHQDSAYGLSDPGADNGDFEDADDAGDGDFDTDDGAGDC